MAASAAMALFKEAPFILSDDYFYTDHQRARYESYIGVAKKYNLPLQLSVRTKKEALGIREAARQHDVRLIVTGVVELDGSPEESGVDMLHAHVGGSLEEAHATARTLSETGLPFSISAGVRLAETIARLDADPAVRPWHYTIGDVDPPTAIVILEALFRGAPELAHRVVGINADARNMQAQDFAGAMHAIASNFGLHVLGGADGMDMEKIEALAAQAR